jgi:hypothetical protein
LAGTGWQITAANLFKSANHFNKLHEDTEDVLRDARASPEFQSAEDEAKEQRIAQLVLPNLVLRTSSILD